MKKEIVKYEQALALKELGFECLKKLVKWIVLKPLVKLSYIINGKMMGDIKWYQRHFTTTVRWRWLNSVTYKLTKYVMFY